MWKLSSIINCIQCVDEWLRVNASCPTCRASIFQVDGEAVLPSRGIGRPSSRIAVGTPRNESVSAERHSSEDEADEETAHMVSRDRGEEKAGGGRRPQQQHGVEMYSTEFEV